MRLPRACSPAGYFLNGLIEFVHRHSQFLLDDGHYDVHRFRRRHVLELFEMTPVRLGRYLGALVVRTGDRISAQDNSEVMQISEQDGFGCFKPPIDIVQL